MSEIEIYRQATSIAQMDASHIPAIAQQLVAASIHEHYAPWAERESSAPPAMAYRHWADLIRSTVYGPGATQETARHGDPMDYRTFLYLKAFAAQHIAEWCEEGAKLDPIKGYKIARKIAAPMLEEEAARFRVAVRILEDDMLDVIRLMLPPKAA